uniref:Uncharacterized protein n=1 Tax=viral metagenome TaxID=1070528 RepID=A0A6C0B9K4_9ZZZZ
MSSRSKVLGAGLAGSSMNNVSINGNSYGGDKKQGLVPLVGRQNWSNRDVKINANGQNKSRYVIFCMNQLGGVGANRSQFNTATSYSRPDAVKNMSLACNPLSALNYH